MPSSELNFDLYLASQSPRRRELLTVGGWSYELLLPDAQEDAEALEVVLPQERPQDYVVRVTGLKAQAAAARWHLRAQNEPTRWPKRPILCADTTVAVDHDILGKPQDEAEAFEMLMRLSGRVHHVFTAIALDDQVRLSCSTVQWRSVSAQEVQDYIQTGEPMGKAGAYAMQGRAARWTQHVEGSHSAIVGLPLFDLDQLWLARSGKKA